MNIAVANQVPSNGSAQSDPVTAGARARRPDSTTSTAASGGMAFEALLAAMQLVTPEALAGRLEVSAEQMFEAPDTAGKSGGEQAGQKLDESLDPTSLAARKATRNAQQATGVTQNSNECPSAKPVAATEAGATSLERGTLPGKGTPLPAQDLSESGKESLAAATRSAGGVKVPSTGSPGAPPTPSTPTVNSAAAVTPAAADTAKPAGESVARQVGQVLNSMRGAEASATRTATAQASNADARAPASSEKNAQTSSSQKNTQTQTPAEAEKTDETRSSMFARLVRSIRLQGGPYASSARIELDPPELGRMRIDVRVAGDEVRIGVRTENSEARDLLNDRLASLRSALEQHGLRVERVEVVTDPEALHRPEVSQSDTTGAAHGDSSPTGQREADAGQGQSDTQSDTQVPATAVTLEGATEGADESVESESWAGSETRLDVRV